MNPKKPYVLATLCYGQSYANLFLNNLLKSVLDESNLPALAPDYEMEYLIYTDEETLPSIAQHPNFARLNRIAKVDVHTLAWPQEMGPDDAY